MLYFFWSFVFILERGGGKLFRTCQHGSMLTMRSLPMPILFFNLPKVETCCKFSFTGYLLKFGAVMKCTGVAIQTRNQVESRVTDESEVSRHPARAVGGGCDVTCRVQTGLRSAERFVRILRRLTAFYKNVLSFLRVLASVWLPTGCLGNGPHNK